MQPSKEKKKNNNNNNNNLLHTCKTDLKNREYNNNNPERSTTSGEKIMQTEKDYKTVRQIWYEKNKERQQEKSRIWYEIIKKERQR